MGREIKRVPVDFEWPIGQTWPGYKVSLCAANDENCEQCKLFGKIVGLGIANSCGCPKFTLLDPPVGEGYQFWETVTEGSPQSPVFATPEELAHWLADTKASAFGSIILPYEKWLAWIKGGGWAPSAVIVAGELRSGVEAFAENAMPVAQT